MSDVLAARQKMVDGQVRPSDVTDLRIIDAMLAIPREAFVPGDRRALAYLDLDIDVGETPAAKEFLIKPVVLAKMLQAADIAETDRVLVAGCATGYAAAVEAIRHTALTTSSCWTARPKSSPKPSTGSSRSVAASSGCSPPAGRRGRPW